MAIFVKFALAAFSLLACSTQDPLSPSTGVKVPIVRFRADAYPFAFFSGETEPVRIVVRDAATWQSVWNTLYQRSSQVPPLPKIDFRTESVVVAALGERGSGGYSVVFTGASENTAGGVNVTVRSTSPGSGCASLAVLTQPVDIARIPARYSRVQFVEEEAVAKCD